MTIEEYKQTWSDFHKEAYGFRPRGNYPELTVEQWAEEFNLLAAVCAANAKEEAANQAFAASQTEALIASLIKRGAANREVAVRWLHEAHNTGGDNDYLCYELGLSYGYFRVA